MKKEIKKEFAYSIAVLLLYVIAFFTAECLEYFDEEWLSVSHIALLSFGMIAGLMRIWFGLKA